MSPLAYVVSPVSARPSPAARLSGRGADRVSGNREHQRGRRLRRNDGDRGPCAAKYRPVSTRLRRTVLTDWYRGALPMTSTKLDMVLSRGVPVTLIYRDNYNMTVQLPCGAAYLAAVIEARRGLSGSVKRRCATASRA